jgi:hypothetical protein
MKPIGPQRRAQLELARRARRLTLPAWKQKDRALADRARLRFTARKVGELTRGVTELLPLPNGTGKPDTIYIRYAREGRTMPWRKRRTT